MNRNFIRTGWQAGSGVLALVLFAAVASSQSAHRPSQRSFAEVMEIVEKKKKQHNMIHQQLLQPENKIQQTTMLSELPKGIQQMKSIPVPVNPASRELPSQRLLKMPAGRRM